MSFDVLGPVLAVLVIFAALIAVLRYLKAKDKSFTFRVFTALGLGIVLGATGVGKWALHSSAGELLGKLIGFLTAPTSVLILLIVGYELSVSRSLMKPVLITALLRLAVMGALCGVCALIVFSLTPFDKKLLVALLLGFSLPAPFIIPLFADTAGHGEYISTTLSFSTLFSILAFIGVAVYTLA